ncbi:MAG TPA: ATP-dependent RNA helicase [Syntrophorhabdus aromaticivorans]|nr:ATP-dependent RNA helicase [Syntrophorhabdus aromaticivorans]
MQIPFSELNLSGYIVKAVEDMGFSEATPIQETAIPLIMSGRDIIGQSQTGTGKTASFGIPCIEKTDPSDKSLQSIILCPTRELAVQVCGELRKLGKYRESVKLLAVYGGQPIERQILALKKGVQIVVGTPGRVIDHINRRTLKLENVSCVVLDEADEMLDMGFRDDIYKILEKTPEDRQTLLFSATMSKEVLEIAKNFMNEPKMIKTSVKELTVPSIEQYYFEVKEKAKTEALIKLLDYHRPSLSMVFCNTKRRADEVALELKEKGISAEALHGDLKQMQRDDIMKRFRGRLINVLVATDVAARGIDVDDVDIVFNYDIPQDLEYYVHRIGRTGRAGKEGLSLTFCSGREMGRLRDIMIFTKTKILRGKLPSKREIEEIGINSLKDEIRDIISKGGLKKRLKIINELSLEGYDSSEIAAALLTILRGEDSTETEKDSFLESFGENEGFPVRFFIDAGKKQNVRVKDIVGAISGETGIPGKEIGNISLYDDFSLVDIPQSLAPDLLTGMKGKKIKGVRVNITPAKK